jgi:Trp operon repressor
MGPIMGVRQRWRSCAHLPVQSMTPILLALVWKLLLPALLIVALVDVLTQSRSQRIRRLHRGGLSQRSIASRLGVSRYQVQKALA